MTGGAEKRKFDERQMESVNQAVSVSEEMVSNYYKLSDTQMLQLNYDIRTASRLAPHEIVEDHFAQIVRYRARKKASMLETEAEDFYLLCIQDHAILDAIDRFRALRLYPFMLYIVCHELIHVVRFRRYLQHFHVEQEKRQLEEIRVHHETREVLRGSRARDLDAVLEFYGQWREAFEQMDEIRVRHTPPEG